MTTAWRPPDTDDVHDTLLEFNAHVFELARHPRTPLGERVRFLTILGSNLNEFFTVHVGEAKAWLAAQGAFGADGGPRAASVQALIRETMQSARAAGALLRGAREWFRNECRPACAAAGVRLHQWDELTDTSRAAAAAFFDAQVRPALGNGVPLRPVGPDGQGMPHLASLALALVVTADTDDALYVIPIPATLSRAVELIPHAEYMGLEDLIRAHAGVLTPAGAGAHAFVVRVTRASDTRLGRSPAGDPVETARALLARREMAPVVRLEVNCAMPDAVRKRLLVLFRAEAQAVGVEGSTLDACDVFETDGPVVSLEGLDRVASIPRTDWGYPAFAARTPVPVEQSLWERLGSGDVFVHFPYDAFASSIARFFDEAADDPDVVALRSTIYRTDRHSPVVVALARAARAGKDVLVVVELMARFDEASNLDWSRHLSEAGCRVVHAPPGLKVHGKIGLAIRREGGANRGYGFVSTGNLNAVTATRYTDFALLTARSDLVGEIATVFDEIGSGDMSNRYTRLLVSPTTMRTALIALIEREASRGAAGRIRAKLNGLNDDDIIESLYAASRQGARVDLVVRGLCQLRPGVPGLSDHITVSSIVGRFLEHGRIYAFGGAGGPIDYYIGSADWRTRNIAHRVEVAVPVEDPDARQRIEELLEAELTDPTRFVMRTDRSYGRAETDAESVQERWVSGLRQPPALV